MSDLELDTPFGKALLFLICGIAGVLVAYAFFIPDNGAQYKPKANAACDGTPIKVDYPYYGGMLEPHACQPQCDDHVQHYVLYTNGKATQCQKIPGCLDWGEDQGVACVPSK